MLADFQSYLQAAERNDSKTIKALDAKISVVREGDATPTGASIGDARVLGEFVASPQRKNAAVSSEEGGLLDVEPG